MPGKIVRTIETWIDISAPAERIWNVLIHFDDYPVWNPFVTRIVGVPREGSKLQVQIKPPGRSGMTFSLNFSYATSLAR
jgi:hypothetical protein